MQREIPSEYNFVESLYPSNFSSSHLPYFDYVTGDSNTPTSIINSQLNNDDMLLKSFLPHSHQNQIQLQHQDLIDRHQAVLSYLQKTARQVQSLRQDNVNLKMANIELNHRLDLFLSAASSYGLSGLDPGSSSGWDPLVDGLQKMSLGGGEEGSGGEQEWENEVAVASLSEGHSESPKSVADLGRVGGSPVERVTLPKSISVRSSGYLKNSRAAGMSDGGGRVKANDQSKQRVYVGGKKAEEALELEVYNQGMIKTELCNKWQQTGTCPYGENCQFAHGIEELRPVLRHPRYKTEVCRMVLNGDHCPYGHRCHFRHSLTEQEKLTRSMNATNSRSLKPINYR